ncbi:signal transduction histidine kinase [Motilibacter rhizosphaerae]|uniref:histidine kinase n=1 Tax=Motilibacter rhizosphaerae TaxID=598652 RepID=A0A4Q7NQ42_9ACTN|nr:sensor histidine kinase [Motilibacter rhizosphaerae]RZS87198.1 signal transduction histidine kinase [Motilibacter rhizosphaerae]
MIPEPAPEPAPAPRERPPLLAAVAHVALDPWVALVGFIVVVVMLSVSAGLVAAFLLGLPLLALTLLVSDRLAAAQRARLAAVLGVVVPAPARPVPRAPGLVARVGARLRSRAQWKQVAYHLCALPVALVVSLLPVVLAGAGVALVSVLGWSTLLDRSRVGLLDSGWLLAAWTLLGLVALALVVPAVRLAVLVDVGLARGLLGADDRAALVARVDTLVESRAGAVAAADLERQRIERDLHDGAQQRLVSLAMSLGRAQHQLDSDPERARLLLAQASDEAKQALAEIRDLVRGIHPSILTDRGLEAALGPVAARLPVPVVLDVDVQPRPAADVEGAAYFTVVEALTNVAKHAGASTAAVTVRRRGDRLEVEVRDDGRGGASADGGTGLRGLAQRLAAVDGTLAVESPPGGPTVLTAVVPCGGTPS